MAILLTNGDDSFFQSVDQPIDVKALGGADQVSIIALAPVAIRLFGGTGADRLYVDNSVGGQVEIYGEDGNDQITIDRFPNGGLARGGAGDDRIEIGDGQAFGDDGNDVIFGGIASVHGGAGDDYLEGYFLFGGTGSDIVRNGITGHGEAGDDNIRSDFGFGDAGDDEVVGAITASGGEGHDLVRAPNEVEGGPGHDVFFPLDFITEVPPPDPSYFIPPDMDFRRGEDRMATPFAIDIVDAFTGEPGQAVATGPAGSGPWLIDRDGDGVGDLISEISPSDLTYLTIDGTDADETKAGVAADEIMVGNGGDDRLSGLAGDDWLFGGLGADVLSGGSGEDLLVGNAGRDTVNGGTGDDEISAGDGDDVASGNDGDDWIKGGIGNDRLAGGNGADLLQGQTESDRLNGGAGDDVLNGGAGRDYLLGGAGADIFLFRPGESGVGAAARDHIGDFEPGVDKIDLTGIAGASFNIVAAVGYDVVAVDALSNGSIDMEIRVDSLSGAITSGDILS